MSYGYILVPEIGFELARGTKLSVLAGGCASPGIRDSDALIPMNFFWILVFGSFVALTERPIALVAGVNDVPLRAPIFAVTHGASIFVDITSMIPKDEVTIDLSRRWVEKNVSAGCLQAVLQADNTGPVALEFKGSSSFEPGKVFLILASGSGVPVRQDFRRLSLTSCVPLRQVMVYWRNHQK